VRHSEDGGRTGRNLGIFGLALFLFQLTFICFFSSSSAASFILVYSLVVFVFGPGCLFIYHFLISDVLCCH